MNQGELERHFEALDKRFFDGRLLRDGWRVRLVSELQFSGLCFAVEKVILLDFHTARGPNLTPVLLHECAHAAAGDMSHSPRWQAEMQRLAVEGAPADEFPLRYFAHLDGFPYVRRVARPPGLRRERAASASRVRSAYALS